MIIVDLVAAMICFAGACYPALVGGQTPTGTYQVVRYKTPEPKYGGDVLVFKIDYGKNHAYSIHRVIDVKNEKRRERLTSNDADDRKSITNGCINIRAEVYDKLVACCQNSKVSIK